MLTCHIYLQIPTYVIVLKICTENTVQTTAIVIIWVRSYSFGKPVGSQCSLLAIGRNVPDKSCTAHAAESILCPAQPLTDHRCFCGLAQVSMGGRGMLGLHSRPHTAPEAVSGAWP